MELDLIDKLVQEKKINQKTADRVHVFKSYIEKKYYIKKQKDLSKRKEWETICQAIESLSISQEEKEKIKNEYFRKESESMRKKRHKKTIFDFQSIGIIGRGAFGEVRLCRDKETKEVVAIKKMRKIQMKKKNEILHVLHEKDLMSNKLCSKWIVGLRYSFQDEEYLYLVMDFLPGGDLMNFLILVDTLKEKDAKFYLAEICLCVNSIHKMGCIHRDIKPDNILITKTGHLRLSDFGLAKLNDKLLYPLTSIKLPDPNCATEQSLEKPFSENREVKTSHSHRAIFQSHTRGYSFVGTPDYMAPDVFDMHGYDNSIDWWSVGIIFFEMLFGYTPFHSENQKDVCRKILKWKENFNMPSNDEVRISSSARDLIKSLIAPKEVRIKTFEEIKKHSFFKGFDWDNIENMKPPFIPEISSDCDMKYFDKFNEKVPFYPQCSSSKNFLKKKDLSFAGYTFNRDIENYDDKKNYRDILKKIEKIRKQLETEKSKEKKSKSSSKYPSGSSKETQRQSKNSKTKDKRNASANHHSKSKEKKVDQLKLRTTINLEKEVNLLPRNLLFSNSKLSSNFIESVAIPNISKEKNRNINLKNNTTSLKDISIKKKFSRSPNNELTKVSKGKKNIVIDLRNYKRMSTKVSPIKDLISNVFKKSGNSFTTTPRSTTRTEANSGQSSCKGFGKIKLEKNHKNGSEFIPFKFLGKK